MVGDLPLHEEFVPWGKGTEVQHLGNGVHDCLVMLTGEVPLEIHWDGRQ